MSAVAEQWRRFLASRKDLVGGELEHVEFPEGAFRGPISSITVKGEELVVASLWVARMRVNQRGMPIGDGWDKVTRPDVLSAKYSLVDDVMSSPQDIGQGRVFFTYAFAHVTIFPKGGSKLDPKKVRGL